MQRVCPADARAVGPDISQAVILIRLGTNLPRPRYCLALSINYHVLMAERVSVSTHRKIKLFRPSRTKTHRLSYRRKVGFRLRQEPVPPNGPSSTTLPSSGRRHERAIARFPSQLLPATDQHIAAGAAKLCALFLEASQDSEIALIHQLTAETLHVARASFLLLIGAAVSEGAH